MCGIAGVVRFGGVRAEEARAVRDRIAHRGPDGCGDVVTSDGCAALAHARLAMVELGEAGAQPFVDGELSIVYNGELYNHDALRARLAGRVWRGRSDTETVLAAWRAWGPACVDALDGMYAFFVWDARASVGWAVRDRLGVKPLAYARLADGGLAFASEAHALVATVGGARANRGAILEVLVAPMFSGVVRSAFAGIEYLAPGSVLRIDREGATTRRYWRWPDDESARVGVSAIVEVAEVRAALVAAVSGASRADVPLGVFLSGGLDSTALAALAPNTGPAFAIAFDGMARWERERGSRLVVSDDGPFARIAARAVGRPLFEVAADRGLIGGDDGELAALARTNDALPAWEQELAQRALSRAAAAHVKGVLVGDAADETHHGYHFVLDAAGPRALFERLGAVPLARSIDREAVHARLDEEYRAIGALPRIVVERWLPRLLHDGDIHAMAFGLEARVPFAATALVERAARIPLARARDKAVLRAALAGAIPEAIRTRRKSALPKDQGAGAIYAAELARIARDPHPLVRELVDLDAIAQLPDDEPSRAIRFRTLGLHHWATGHGVRA